MRKGPLGLDGSRDRGSKDHTELIRSYRTVLVYLEVLQGQVELIQSALEMSMSDYSSRIYGNGHHKDGGPDGSIEKLEGDAGAIHGFLQKKLDRIKEIREGYGRWIRLLEKK